jgi:hypothetical protein
LREEMKRALPYLTISALLASLLLPTIATGGPSGPTESWSRSDRSRPVVYTMHREGLRVRLEVRGSEIFPTRVWARRKCSNGFEGGSGLLLEEPVSAIPIRPHGRFGYRSFIGEGFWSLTRLSGRVYSRAIRGFYLERSREGAGPACGTGRPGDRALHFVARADRS